MTCDDKTCGYVSRHVSVKNFKNAHVCTHCHKGNNRVEVSELKSHTQNSAFWVCFACKYALKILALFKAGIPLSRLIWRNVYCFFGRSGLENDDGVEFVTTFPVTDSIGKKYPIHLSSTAQPVEWKTNKKNRGLRRSASVETFVNFFFFFFVFSIQITRCTINYFISHVFVTSTILQTRYVVSERTMVSCVELRIMWRSNFFST